MQGFMGKVRRGPTPCYASRGHQPSARRLQTFFFSTFPFCSTWPFFFLALLGCGCHYSAFLVLGSASLWRTSEFQSGYRLRLRFGLLRAGLLNKALSLGSVRRASAVRSGAIGSVWGRELEADTSRAPESRRPAVDLPIGRGKRARGLREPSRCKGHTTLRYDPRNDRLRFPSCAHDLTAHCERAHGAH